MARRNKFAFTLIELLVVMSIIAVVMSALAFPATRAIAHSKFDLDVDCVISKIRMCQELMVDYNIDVDLLLKKDNEQVICQIVPMGCISPQIKSVIAKEYLLKSIDSFQWNHAEKNCQRLHFYSWGTLPEGVLSLLGNEQMDLYFSGILAGTRKKILSPITNEKNAIYPEEAALLPFN